MQNDIENKVANCLVIYLVYHLWKKLRKFKINDNFVYNNTNNKKKISKNFYETTTNVAKNLIAYFSLINKTIVKIFADSLNIFYKFSKEKWVHKVFDSPSSIK